MARRASPAPEPLPFERAEALTISGLYDQVQGALARAFPRTRTLWVRGEIQSLSDRTGHCYIDLVDPDSHRGRDTPVLKVRCWRSTWLPLRAALHDNGVALEPGTVVVLQGRVDFYRARAEVNFVVDGLDVSALVGAQAARRAALLRTLDAEGLLRANAARSVVDVPLRVGLVGSPDTEGCRDFLGQLQASPYAFAVALAPAQVQGPGAPRSIVSALRSVFHVGVDVVVVVRGGGSRADLVAFDAEPVARAIATAPVPVWTGVGHSGDQSVADVVANRSFITPTECGHELVAVVDAWWQRTADAACTVAAHSSDVLRDALQRDRAIRARLAACTRHQLDRHRERLGGRSGRIASLAPSALDAAHERVAARAATVGPLARARLDHQHDKVVSWRRLLAAYDIDRQLERGYSLTLDDAGRVVRSVTRLRPGSVLVTRLADGTARSTVTETTLATAAASGVARPATPDTDTPATAPTQEQP